MGSDVVHLALVDRKKEEQGGSAPLPEEVVCKSNDTIERGDSKPLMPPTNRILRVSGGH